MGALVIVLLLVVIIFGIASGMQSYATAQQAQATIELAQVAQVNAWGNLITILTLALVIVFALALVALFVYLRHGRSVRRLAPSAPRTAQPGPQLSTSDLIQLLILEKLGALDQPAKPQVPEPTEETSSHEIFHWLK